MADRSQVCSIWVGSETGILKGVSLAKKQAFNFCEMSCLSRDQEVSALCWGDQQETEVLVGSVNGTVKTFSTEKGIFTETRQCGDTSQGRFTGLAVTDSSLITCVESGLLRVWKEGTDTVEINAGKNVCRMRQNPSQRHQVATGGKENGLKVWDLERPDAAIFTSKNVRNDWLDLRVPEWVRDMAFIPNSDKIVTCTGHHQVRVYDPASPQRRPVLEAQFGEYPLTALSLPANQDSVLVGNTHGHLAILDLRKGLVRRCLKGLAGGVRGLQCHPSLPLVASCGLDRFLRVHSLEDGSLQHKVYLKSRLNCVLLSSRDLELGGSGDTGDVEEVKEEDEEVWDAMEKVQEKPEKRKVEEEETAECAVKIPKKKSAQMIPKKKSAQMIPKKKNSQTIPKKKSAQTIPKKKSAQTIPKKKSAETIPKKKSAETIPKKKSAETIPKKKSAETIPKKKRKVVQN